MIGDWDTDRQPAAAPREPMAQRGGRKIDAGGATSLAISGRLEDRRFEAGVLPVVSRNSFRHPYACCRSSFHRDPLRYREPGARSCRSSLHCNPCVIEDGCSGLKPLPQKPIFVGAASAATFTSSKTGGSELSKLLSLRPRHHRG